MLLINIFTFYKFFVISSTAIIIIFQHLINILNLTNCKMSSVLTVNHKFFIIIFIIFWHLANVLILMNYKMLLILNVNYKIKVKNENENNKFVSKTDCLYFYKKFNSVIVISESDCFNFNNFYYNCFLILLFFIFLFYKYILIFSLKMQF